MTEPTEGMPYAGATGRPAAEVWRQHPSGQMTAGFGLPRYSGRVDAAAGFSAARAGDLLYVSLDGTTVHYPGEEAWIAGGIADLDLWQLRTLLILALSEVEDGLDARSLLGRVTKPAEVM